MNFRSWRWRLIKVRSIQWVYRSYAVRTVLEEGTQTSVNAFGTKYSNTIGRSARPLRDIFPYSAIATAYNSPIMHNV